LVQQQRRIVQLEDELQRAWAEIDRLRTKIAAVERERQRSDDDAAKQPRYWTPEEHRLFMDAVQRYGWKDVKSIAQHVGTRTPTQVRTHAQKLFLRQQKETSGIMQPVKNGRTDMPPGVLEGMGDGGGQLQVDQLQALQEAGYLAQMQDQAASSGFSAMAPAPAGLPSSLGPGCDLSGMGSQMGSASGSAGGAAGVVSRAKSSSAGTCGMAFGQTWENATVFCHLSVFGMSESPTRLPRLARGFRSDAASMPASRSFFKLARATAASCAESHSPVK